MQLLDQLLNISGRPIVLASNSPRRKELLHALGLTFEVRKAEVEEDFPPDLPARHVAKYLAEKKAAYFKKDLLNEILITADTVVLVDNTILNKPGNESEAREMLTQLSGKKHEVISAVCLSTNSSFISFDDITEVHFRKLQPEEIDYYIYQYKPFDKAGSYGIQEWIGMVAIERIVGSYFNVMGLPVHKLFSYLKKI